MGHTPNHSPVGERVVHAVLSVFLIGYGLFGVITDELFIPGKRTRGVHLHGMPAALMFVAMLSASAVLMSVVIDHYDQRNNERNYKLFARIGEVVGWSFFGSALALDLFQNVAR